MKLYEIPNYLDGVKVSKSIWDNKYYVKFNAGYWEDTEGYSYPMDKSDTEQEWELYKKPTLRFKDLVEGGKYTVGKYSVLFMKKDGLLWNVFNSHPDDIDKYEFVEVVDDA